MRIKSFKNQKQGLTYNGAPKKDDELSRKRKARLMILCLLFRSILSIYVH